MLNIKYYYIILSLADSVNNLVYPATLFKYAGLGKSPGSQSYFCLIDQCKIKGKRLAVTPETRGNIRKHVKVINLFPNFFAHQLLLKYFTEMLFY